MSRTAISSLFIIPGIGSRLLSFFSFSESITICLLRPEIAQIVTSLRCNDTEWKQLISLGVVFSRLSDLDWTNYTVPSRGQDTFPLRLTYEMFPRLCSLRCTNCGSPVSLDVDPRLLIQKLELNSVIVVSHTFLHRVEHLSVVTLRPDLDLVPLLPSASQVRSLDIFLSFSISNRYSDEEKERILRALGTILPTLRMLTSFRLNYAGMHLRDSRFHLNIPQKLRYVDMKGNVNIHCPNSSSLLEVALDNKCVLTVPNILHNVQTICLEGDSHKYPLAPNAFRYTRILDGDKYSLQSFFSTEIPVLNDQYPHLEEITYDFPNVNRYLECIEIPPHGEVRDVIVKLRADGIRQKGFTIKLGHFPQAERISLLVEMMPEECMPPVLKVIFQEVPNLTEFVCKSWLPVRIEPSSLTHAQCEKFVRSTQHYFQLYWRSKLPEMLQNFYTSALNHHPYESNSFIESIIQTSDINPLIPLVVETKQLCETYSHLFDHHGWEDHPKQIYRYVNDRCRTYEYMRRYARNIEFAYTRIGELIIEAKQKLGSFEALIQECMQKEGDMFESSWRNALSEHIDALGLVGNLQYFTNDIQKLIADCHPDIVKMTLQDVENAQLWVGELRKKIESLPQK